jgi:NAD-dependent deacetylase
MPPEISKFDQAIRHAAQLIQESQHAIALTGAGISTPSGIPDFRSSGSGLWQRYDPMEVASLTAFRYQPEKFFAWLRNLVLEIVQAEPNPAHTSLARLEKAGKVQAIITQNIDDLHQRAGSKNVLEVHGTMRTLTCIHCYRKYDSSGFIEPYLENGEIPHCQNCGNILKPDVVLFEEQLPYKTWQKAQEQVNQCDLMIVCGSSLEVVPVAGLPMQALYHGSSLIVVNETPTYVDEQAEVVIQDDVAEVIPRIATKVLDE